MHQAIMYYYTSLEMKCNTVLEQGRPLCTDMKKISQPD